MRRRAVAGWVLCLCFVGTAAGANLGGRAFLALSFGGASLVKEGGTFAVLQGDFRGPVLNVGTTGIVVEYVGYRAAYDGCFLLHATVGWRVTRRLALTGGAEFDWPRYRLTAYSWTSGLYADRSWGEEPNAPPGLKVNEKSYFFAPTVGVRVQLADDSQGPFLCVEWGKVLRHADVRLDQRHYYTGWPYETRVRDRDTKGLMRVGVGSEYRISGHTAMTLYVGLSSVRDSGLFFLDYESGAQYITFDGRIGVAYQF